MSRASDAEMARVQAHRAEVLAAANLPDPHSSAMSTLWAQRTYPHCDVNLVGTGPIWRGNPYAAARSSMVAAQEFDWGLALQAYSDAARRVLDAHPLPTEGDQLCLI